MEQGGITEPDGAAPNTGARDLKRMSIIAACAAAPFVLIHVVMATLVASTFAEMYASMGGELPMYSALMMVGAKNGLLVVLLVLIDVAVFAAMYLVARRYHAGLVFVALPVYVVMIGLFVLALYLPMYSIISYVE